MGEVIMTVFSGVGLIVLAVGVILVLLLVYVFGYVGLVILFARLVRSDSDPSIPEKNEYLGKCSRICADPSTALEEIKADPDVIEHLPPEIRNRPEVIALTEDRAFVLQIISPEAPPFVDYQNRDAYQARRDRFGDSIFPGEKWRRLRYLPEHWRSDKEIIKVAFHDALEAFSETSPDYDGNPDEFLFGSGIGDLFDLIPDELLNDPEMLFEFEQSLIATLAPHIPLLSNDRWGGYDEVFGYSLEMYELDDFPSLDSLANLTWYLDALEEHRSSWEDAPIISHPIPDRLVNAVGNAREEIDALAAEKEQQRLRKTLVDELSNLRNRKTTDDDRG